MTGQLGEGVQGILEQFVFVAFLYCLILSQIQMRHFTTFDATMCFGKEPWNEFEGRKKKRIKKCWLKLESFDDRDGVGGNGGEGMMRGSLD